MLDRMTIDQFAREVGDRLEQFVKSVKQAQAEGADGFVGDTYERRTFDDWLTEFGACETIPAPRPSAVIGSKIAVFDQRRRSTGGKVLAIAR